MKICLETLKILEILQLAINYCWTKQKWTQYFSRCIYSESDNCRASSEVSELITIHQSW